ncbi:unnamed protein product [Jaminaea pallidilutea]
MDSHLAIRTATFSSNDHSYHHHQRGNNTFTNLQKSTATMVSSTARLASSSLLRSIAPRATAAPALSKAPLTLAAVAPRTAAAAASPAFAAAAASPSSIPFNFGAVRFASSSSLSHQEIQNRILDILKSFEKVDPSKVNADASFTSTLGLDSLDAVEVVMAIEEEFNIEIPDADADAIQTVGQAIEYISKTPEAQ